MKILVALALLSNLLWSHPIIVYLYSPEVHVNNFKSLKIGFDSYLSTFGPYELQPFNDKKTFEQYLGKHDAVVILSSWHYQQIAASYHLEAILVARKNGSVTDRKILVGRKNTPLSGLVTSAYDGEYTADLLRRLTDGNTKRLSVLKVPKEIDALMSVGFGMSKFALVSRESLNVLQSANPALAQDFKIYYESDPEFRMILASNTKNAEALRVISLFRRMGSDPEGRKFLNIIGMDAMATFEPKNLSPLGVTE